jgi:hypothetical protein
MLGVVTSEAGPVRRCPTCGRPLDEHDRHVRFRVPDPVLAVDGWEALPDTWLSDPDPGKAVMMQVPGLAARTPAQAAEGGAAGSRVATPGYFDPPYA